MGNSLSALPKKKVNYLKVTNYNYKRSILGCSGAVVLQCTDNSNHLVSLPYKIKSNIAMTSIRASRLYVVKSALYLSYVC